MEYLVGMNKIIQRVLIFLFFTVCNPLFAKQLELPADSKKVSKETAISLLELSTKHTKKLTADIFEQYGFTAVAQRNYNRPSDQIDHTSAYSICKGTVYIEEKLVSAYLIVVRGSDGTEWCSNFDFNPSASENTHFAMNFMSSAEDVFLDFTKIVKDKKSVIVVAGHSRGAAVSNLLGLLLNQTYDSSKIYVYTFATPATIRNLDSLNDENIFNFINPCDVVPRVPPVQFGYVRAGTDLYLDKESQTLDAEKLTATFDKFAKICPDIDSYYNKALDISQLGFDFGLNISDTKVTLYQLLLALSTELSKWTFTEDSEISVEGFEDNSKAGFILQEHMPDTYQKKLLRY